jgi:hypothetical protein
MEDVMFARAILPRKRRCVVFRRTRSPRELLANLPFRRPSDVTPMPTRDGQRPRT